MIKGIVLNSENAHEEDLQRAGGLWTYHGGPQPPIYPGIESVPVIPHGEEGISKIGGNSKYLLTWNEPDMGGPWLTPEDAAIRWHDLIEPLYYPQAYRPLYQLMAPSIAIWPRNWLPTWYDTFQQEYGRPPRFRGVSIHGYSSPGRDVIPEFTAALAWARSKGKVLWITEYAALPHQDWTEKQMLAEAWRVIGWARLNSVARFAWFNTRTRGDEKWAMDTNAPLFDYDNGMITASGRLYAAWNGG